MEEIKNKIKNYKSVAEMEEAFNKIYPSYYTEILEKIKAEFVREAIKKYNTMNLKNHKLKDENNINRDYRAYKNLIWEKTFNFEEIENYIKGVFAEYTTEDKIKQVLPYINIEKTFNKENKSYFSFYDFQKEVTEEEFIKIIEDKKELCFSAYNLNDNYYMKDRINEILEFIEYAFNIKINLGVEIPRDLKAIQEHINKNKEVKIRLYNGWFYLSFKDEAKQRKLKDMIIKHLIKRRKNL